MSQKTKIVCIVIGSIVLIVGFIVGLILFSNYTAIEEQRRQQEAEYQQRIQGAQATYEENVFNLEDASQVDPAVMPLLYDFTNGCVGYKYNKIDIVNTATFVVATQKDSSRLYVTFKPSSRMSKTKDKLLKYMPVYSCEPVQFDFTNKDERDTFIREIEQKVSEDKISKVEENNYVFYIANYDSLEDKTNLCSLDLTFFKGKFHKGNYYKDYLAGKGISIDLIRTRCDLQKIKNETGWDFSNVFWDTRNPFSSYVVYLQSGKPSGIYLTPAYFKATQGDTWVYSYTLSSSPLLGSPEEVDKYLAKEKCETIAQTLERKEFHSSQTKDTDTDKDKTTSGGTRSKNDKQKQSNS